MTPIYKVKPNKNGEGFEKIAYTATPAIMTRGLAFSELQMTFSDEVKMRIAAPIMIPDMLIDRMDENGKYYVVFDREDAEILYSNFMKNYSSKNQNFNIEHTDEIVQDSYILESWIVGDNNKADRSYSEFGIELPAGSIFVVTQFTNIDKFNEFKNKKLDGFSIEGMFSLEPDYNRMANKNNKFNMQLPDGEYVMGDMCYVIVGGEVVETKPCAKAETEMPGTDEEIEIVIEASMPKEEEMAVEDQVIDQPVDMPQANLPSDVVTKAELEQALEDMKMVIANLQSQLNEFKTKEIPQEEVKMSSTTTIADRFSAISKL